MTTERAAQARREYMRRWRSKNKDKVRRYNEKFWIRKAGELMESCNDGQGKIDDR